jgi:uncharacterized protein (TIGR02246 family)
MSPPTASAHPAAASDPGRVAHGFARALLEGDAVAATAYFAADARLLTADGTEVGGRAAIRAVLAQLAASDVRLEILVGRTLLSGEVALHTQYWRRSADAAPEAFESRSTASFVLGRRGERWEIAIASPWGQ